MLVNNRPKLSDSQLLLKVLTKRVRLSQSVRNLNRLVMKRPSIRWRLQTRRRRKVLQRRSQVTLPLFVIRTRRKQSLICFRT